MSRDYLEMSKKLEKYFYSKRRREEDKPEETAQDVANEVVLEKFGKFITSQYELVRRIFKYLPTDKLVTAGRVCKEWHDISKLELQLRTKPVCFCWSAYDKNNNVEQQMIKTFKGGFNGVPYFGIIFHNQTPINVNAESWAIQTITRLPKTLNSLGVLAEKFSELSYYDKLFNMNLSLAKCVETFSKEIIPNVSDIRLLNVYSFGAIGMQNTTCLGNTSRPIAGFFSGLFIPKMPDVNITFFNEWNSVETDDLIRRTRIDEKPIKCLIMLMGETELDLTKWVEYFTTRQEEPLPVVGGIVTSIGYSETQERPLFQGIAISGDNVRAKTLMFPRHYHKKKTILDRMSTFTPPKGKHVVAIYFTCVGRATGSWIKNAQGPEYDHFRKVFPDIPFTGCYVNGELWLDENKPDENPPPKKKFRMTFRNSLLHGYSSVILFLAFGPE